MLFKVLINHYYKEWSKLLLVVCDNQKLYEALLFLSAHSIVSFYIAEARLKIFQSLNIIIIVVLQMD